MECHTFSILILDFVDEFEIVDFVLDETEEELVSLNIIVELVS